MKRTILLSLFSVFTLLISAQSADHDYYKGLEHCSDLNLSADQVAKIRQLKREVGPKFAAIGKDRTLSGYEKGQKKRELALQHKAEIRKILTQDQINTWEAKHGKMSEGEGIKNIISDSYDAKLDALEDRYDADKKAIEKNRSLSKKERKEQLKSLKGTYKTEKESLKKQRKVSRETGV